MTCYDESTLRAWLDDQPSLVAEVTPGDISDHVAQCADCQHVTADLLARSSVAASAIALLDGPPATAHHIDTALADVRRPPAASAEVVELAPRRRRSFARPASAVAAAAVVLAIVGTPAGRSSASSFLEQFRSKKIAVIEVSPEDQVAFTELAQLGTVSGVPEGFLPEQVDSLAAAATKVGFKPAAVDPASLPPGITGQPELRVTKAERVRFTLDRAKTQAWIAQQDSSVAVPEKFAGATLVVDVPAVVLQNYPAPDGTPGVIVGQAKQLTASAEGGVTLEEMRSLLLSLPGLSDGTKRQIKAIGKWQETLPLPLPAGEIEWEDAKLAGVDGLLLNDGTGLVSAGVWQRDGFIYGVVVRGKGNAVKDVAAALR